MHTERRLFWLFLVFSFVVLALPVVAQQVIATVPVGVGPNSAAVNTVTNKIYVANSTCPNLPCSDTGTVTVIDGATNNTLSVSAGFYPSLAVVNSATNRIYVTNSCGNDPNCASDGTVTVIDGASNTVIATVVVGGDPAGIAAVNSVTNKIYVVNVCGNDPSCHPYSGTVSVIDGVSNTVVATVPVGSAPLAVAVNPVTDKIYVVNYCGNGPNCAFPYAPGTVTVIDGVTNNALSVNVGFGPGAVAVNSVTNKIYVANGCGDDPNCNSTATMTVIDGQTLGTTDVSIGGYSPFAIAVNSSTNKIYVPSNCNGDPSCQSEPNGTVSVIDGATLTYTSVPAGLNAYPPMAVDSVTNKIYVAECGTDPSCQSNGTVTVIDGATLAFTNVGVGDYPYGLAANSVTNRIYVPNYLDNTVSVIDGTPPTPLQFVPLSQPCRAVDTRPGQGGGGPIQGGTFQNFPISGAGSCGTQPPIP
jgi:YVTN family beta-propeller protein